ncbi:electron transfer flavoprotein subunit beta/FixA family protein [bacterium]|nr:electron transfer flavoprotein subunit beta/FixA family protein [bacterium]
MHIAVCVKQVPDTSEISIDPETNTLVREGVAGTMNPFDAWAIEAAVRIREQCGGRVTALSMGPPQAESVLRTAMALGADRGVLLSDRAFAGADTLATSYALAMGLRALSQVDLVFCGKQAVDGDTAQVGPGIAAQLDWPQICFAKRIVSSGNGSITVERSAESGSDIVTSSLPCVVTVVKDIHAPRFPSLGRQLFARNSGVTVWGAGDIGADPGRCGLTGSPTWVDGIFAPPKREGGRIVRGDLRLLTDAFIAGVQAVSLPPGGNDNA